MVHTSHITIYTDDCLPRPPPQGLVLCLRKFDSYGGETCRDFFFYSNNIQSKSDDMQEISNNRFYRRRNSQVTYSSNTSVAGTGETTVDNDTVHTTERVPYPKRSHWTNREQVTCALCTLQIVSASRIIVQITLGLCD